MRLLLIIIMLLSHQFYAQENLVLNGSFEDTVSCPMGLNGISDAIFFSNPTMGTPDYFNSCALSFSNVSVPNNLGGYQMPRTGEAYAGIVAYGLGTNYKEYIQTKLINILEKDSYYLVQYYVSLGSYASVGCNNLGVSFSSDATFTNNFLTLYSENPIFSSSIVKDTLNWIELSFIYHAKGDENYLLIGNFSDDSNTETLINIGGVGDNYYYIDDISITKIDIQFPNVFTPNNDNVNDLFYFNSQAIRATELTILNRWGNIVYSSTTNFYWNGKSLSGDLCSDGTYFYVIRTKTKTFTGFVELII